MITRPATMIPLILSSILIPLTLAMAFWWTAEDIDQGLSQKIFYLHVPIALTSYVAFGFGAVSAAMYLWRRTEVWDLRSYVGVHSGTIFGTLVLLTGPIWAKASWGVWWNWGDRQINVFLILFLYYCAYFMLRFSLDEGERRRTASAVFALLGVGLIPLSFLAVRIAETLIHPTVFSSSGAAMPNSFLLHQASNHMLSYLVRRMALDPARVPIRIRDTGNLVSSSIPFLIAELAREGALAGKTTLLSGFGVGLSWASTVVRFDADPIS